MGMIANLLQVSSQELDEILSDSSLLEAKVFSQDDAFDDRLLDLDKAWEAILFVVTGHGLAEIDQITPPLSWLLFSEQFVDEDQNLGYGPAHYITDDQVRSLSIELNKVSTEVFIERYDGVQMDEAGIYPEIWGEDESLEYAVEYFEQLKAFYGSAAANGCAVISFIA